MHSTNLQQTTLHLLNRVRNIVEKGNIALYEQFRNIAAVFFKSDQ